MAITISKFVKTSRLPRTARPGAAGRPGRGRDKKPPSNEEIRARSIARDLDGAIGEGPKTASPAAAVAAAAFVSGAKAIAPVLLALVPLGVAFGAAAMGGGLSALEALAMSVFVFAGAAQLATIPLI